MWSLKVTHITLIAITVVSLLDHCVSLKLSKGVCTENVFRDTRRNRKSDIINNTRLVCCDGYKYDSDLDKCLPVCSLGCVNGTCTDVDTCTCAAMHMLVGHTCSPYTCSNCEHGNCVGPNDCICNEGYVKTEYNSVCKPVCVGCDFGDCIAPNNCSCFEGYERRNLTCEPKCSVCGNEECVAPETCRPSTTRPLLEASSVPTCSPPCSNENCLTPNQCFCNKHFNLVCSVVCNHGYCSPPGNCTCKPKKKGKIFRF